MPVGDSYVQDTVMGQVSKAVFSGFPVGVVLVSVVTGLILVLAANTAFNGFPVLGSILARDGFLPRQLHTRGDRLAFSNGIIILAAAAAALIVASTTRRSRALIQLYIVGVFVSFTLSQIGMVRHWTRHLRVERNPRRATGCCAAGSSTASAPRCRGTVLRRRPRSRSSPTAPATPSPRWPCSSS